MIPVFILARLGSQRLPKKHFTIMGNMPMIENVVKRCEHFGMKPHICVPHGERDEFNSHTSCLDIFEGDPDNVEARLIEAAHYYNVQQFHALDGDDPFFDEMEVIDSFNCLFPRLARVYPSNHSQSGSGRHGTSYNLDPQASGERRLLAIPSQPWPQRLTLDYWEDYNLITAVNRMVGGAGYMAPRAAIDQLFVRNPDLHQINWFLTAEWKERQKREHAV